MSRFVDLTGQVFGRLTVLSRGPTVKKHTMWNCKCICGNETVVDAYQLRHGLTQSCGCLQRERASQANFEDLRGRKFGRLTPIEPVGKSGSFIKWKCKCDCGNFTEVASGSLKSGGTKSCGCLSLENLQSRAHDLYNMTFGRLVAMYPLDYKINGNTVWQCLCDCGKECAVTQYHLESGVTRSCGCLASELTSERRKIYTTPEELDLSRRYDNMVSRCYNPNVDSYNRYGDRGITICDEWRNNRHAFIKWALSNGFSPELTIERIDNNGPYAPWNCRWASMQEQCENRRTNLLIYVDGVVHTVTEWGRITGVNRNRISTLYKDNPRAALELIRKYIPKRTEIPKHEGG